MGLNWLDFSKRDTNKALDAMKQLAEHGAIDEIGIGVIRDGFSDIFFPGTSTLHSHTKYLILIPWMIRNYRAISKDKENKITSIIGLEKQMAKSLIANSKSKEGIIGYDKLASKPDGDDFVVYPPSRIYWNALRVFDIIPSKNLSSSNYIKLYLAERDKHRSRGASEGEEEDDEGVFYSYKMNIGGVCKDINLENMQIELNKEEAEYLKDKICTSRPNSLLAFALNENMNLSLYNNFASFYEYLKNKSISDEMKSYLYLANSMNELIYMLRVRYNYILLVKGRDVEIESSKTVNGELFNESTKIINLWDNLPEVKTKVEDINNTQIIINRNNPMYNFLRDALAAYQAKDYEKLDRIIIERERKIKPSRAKLLNKRNYTRPVALGRLDYRLGVARIFCKEINGGLNNGS